MDLGQHARRHVRLLEHLVDAAVLVILNPPAHALVVGAGDPEAVQFTRGGDGLDARRGELQLGSGLVLQLHQHRADVHEGVVGGCALGAGAGGRAGRVCGAVGGRGGTRWEQT